jgi:predicted acylesterase/phospholipase RssA
MTEGTAPARPASYDKKVGLVLQGGGALGSYQAGVYEALASSGYMPDWVAGISIGAVNAAIIAGNAPKDRVHRLRSFWEEITAPHVMASGALPPGFPPIEIDGEQYWDGGLFSNTPCNTWWTIIHAAVG